MKSTGLKRDQISRHAPTAQFVIIPVENADATQFEQRKRES